MAKKIDVRKIENKILWKLMNDNNIKEALDLAKKIYPFIDWLNPGNPDAKNDPTEKNYYYKNIENAKKQILKNLYGLPEQIPTKYLIAYSKYFNVSTDYLLGFHVCKTHDNQFIHDATGLSDNAISTLKTLKNGNNCEETLKTLNYIMGTDFILFFRFIDAISLCFDFEYDTPIHFENGIFVESIDGISDSTITKTNEKYVSIGKYDKTLCNGTGGFRTTSMPISYVKKSYSISIIQDILTTWQNEYNKPSD